MPERDFSDAELIAFMDEALQPSRSSELEAALRDDESLRARLVQLRGRDAAGLHTIGGIWRRGRLSCPSRDDLGAFLLDALEDEHADYIRFHLEQIGCRICAANLEDLKAAANAQTAKQIRPRRTRFFQTSAGYLRKENG
ncbi:MAG: hypothetical protein AAF958_11260 [Planctomycetota bacterium]